jgi:transposase InsO family protein
LWTRLSERTEALWHEVFHESTRRLLGYAPTESLWGHLKVARLHGRSFTTRRAAMDEVIDWLGFYNSARLHQTLGYVSPMVFEQRWTAVQQQDRKTA